MREAVWPSLFSALVFLASLTALLAPIRRAARLPLAVASCIGLAALVCFETLLLNALSLFHGVNRAALLAGHALLLAACLAPAPRLAIAAIADQFAAAWRALRRRSIVLIVLIVLPLVVLALLSATRYAPNNFDAMTYHLARVAHWMQNESVGPYPTGIHRQLVLPAGSDYLLLQLQLVSGHDRLANLLQLLCYLLIVFSAPTLARWAGAPSRLGWFAAVLVATLPMAVLQASSAQNDLVASAVAVALVATSLPFLHAGHPVSRRPSQLLLLTASLVAASLVKPTALFAAAPFLLLAGLATALRIRRGREKLRAYGLPVLMAAALGAIVSLPEIDRRNVYRNAPDLAREFSYPVFGEWADRALNSLRGLAHHVPPPRRWAAAHAEYTGKNCSPHAAAVCVTTQFRAHEDLVGNPAQAIVLVLGALLAAFPGRRVPRRARISAAMLALSWVGFHALLKDNPWIQRLELPLFALSPLALAVFAQRSPGRSRRRSPVAASLAVLLVAYAGFVALRNELSPPFGPETPYERSYYDSFHSQFEPQETTLQLMMSRGCFRLGLSLSEVGYDYPLTWRAMQLGARVRHVSATDPWPCLLYSDHGEPEGARGAGWIPLAGLESDDGRDVPFLFGRAR